MNTWFLTEQAQPYKILTYLLFAVILMAGQAAIFFFLFLLNVLRNLALVISQLRMHLFIECQPCAGVNLVSRLEFLFTLVESLE